MKQESPPHRGKERGNEVRGEVNDETQVPDLMLRKARCRNVEANPESEEVPRLYFH